MDIAFGIDKRPPTEFKLQAAREHLVLERERIQHWSLRLEEGMQGLLIMAGAGVAILATLSIALAAGYGLEGDLTWVAIVAVTPMVWWVLASCHRDALAGQLKKIEGELEHLAPVDEDDSRVQVLQ